MDYNKLQRIKDAGLVSISHIARWLGVTWTTANSKVKNDKLMNAHIQKCIDYNELCNAYMELEHAYNKAMINDRVIDE